MCLFTPQSERVGLLLTKYSLGDRIKKNEVAGTYKYLWGRGAVHTGFGGEIQFKETI
jgi:hypothetical protein